MCKSAVMHMPISRFKTTTESFQMRYCTQFFIMGIKTASGQSENIQKSLLLLSNFGSINLLVLAILMPLEEKLHTVPHMKALISIFEHST